MCDGAVGLSYQWIVPLTHGNTPLARMLGAQDTSTRHSANATIGAADAAGCTEIVTVRPAEARGCAETATGRGANATGCTEITSRSNAEVSYQVENAAVPIAITAFESATATDPLSVDADAVVVLTQLNFTLKETQDGQ